MKQKLTQFIGSRRGVIATEFALVVPLMLIIWLGVVELGSAHLAARKVEMAAQSVADLVAQENNTDLARLSNFAVAIDAILAPFPTSDARRTYTITSIEADDADATSVGWHVAGGTGASPTGTVPAAAEDLVSGNDSVIAVTVSYTHAPWLGRYFVADGDFTMSETAYAKPRLIPVIPCDNCP